MSSATSIVIIPARYASTRFPGKPLADIKGKSMIQRVYEQAQKSASISAVYVATDDERIQKHVLQFGGNVVMTSPNHQSGTDRCAEAMQLIEAENNGIEKADIIINIQGDEPFIQPEQIDALVQLFDHERTEIATLIKPIEEDSVLWDVNKPKVIRGENGNALYFSRQCIPHLRNIPQSEWLQNHTFFKHIGVYAYRRRTLQEITQLLPSLLEQAESLEQLRWLENGFSIQTAITHFESPSIDTPEDLQRILHQNLSKKP
ncbi:MAG: 3-deoxy-manno-octulosonate cytidylyltransferase [Chitinophagales bacterium]